MEKKTTPCIYQPWLYVNRGTGYVVLSVIRCRAFWSYLPEKVIVGQEPRAWDKAVSWLLWLFRELEGPLLWLALPSNKLVRLPGAIFRWNDKCSYLRDSANRNFWGPSPIMINDDHCNQEVLLIQASALFIPLACIYLLFICCIQSQQLSQTSPRAAQLCNCGAAFADHVCQRPTARQAQQTTWPSWSHTMAPVMVITSDPPPYNTAGFCHCTGLSWMQP